MSQIHAEASLVIDAPPEQVYAVLSDYQTGHPAILPKPYFSGITVEQGGKGAGTVFRTSITVMGTTVNYHMTVTEPEPGRVLMETDSNAGTVTTFTIEPVDGGARSKVTIATDAKASGGIKGFLERLMNPSIMRRIYNAELKKLSDYVRWDSIPPAPG